MCTQCFKVVCKYLNSYSYKNKLLSLIWHNSADGQWCPSLPVSDNVMHHNILSVSGRKKIHFSFKDGMEMAEEYDLNTGDLLGW